MSFFGTDLTSPTQQGGNSQSPAMLVFKADLTDVNAAFDAAKKKHDKRVEAFGTFKENFAFYMYSAAGLTTSLLNFLSERIGEHASLLAIEATISTALSTAAVVRIQKEALEAFSLKQIAKGLFLQGLAISMGVNTMKSQFAKIQAFRLRQKAKRMRTFTESFSIS